MSVMLEEPETEKP